MADQIVVIGGSGFIGTRLVRQLQAAGHDVRIVDKAASAAFPDLVTLCDVRDEPGLVDACAGADVIYNLAAEHRDDVRPISLYDEVNVEGARNTGVAAAKNDVQRIVFTSSVAVYGFSDGNTDESGDTRPFNDYGRTKLAAEAVLAEWADADPTRSLTVIRPTVVFGEDNRGNVYNLLRQIAEGPFLMIGDGTNKKSMAYVENVAGFLAFARGFASGQHVYNYIDKPDYDTNALVATIRRALGRNEKASLRMPYGLGYAAGLLADGVAAVVRRPLPFSRIRVQKFCASTVFASDRMRASGYEPPFALDDALSRTIEHEFGGGGAAS